MDCISTFKGWKDACFNASFMNPQNSHVCMLDEERNCDNVTWLVIIYVDIVTNYTSSINGYRQFVEHALLAPLSATHSPHIRFYDICRSHNSQRSMCGTIYFHN